MSEPQQWQCEDCGRPIEDCYCCDPEVYDNSGCNECGGRGWIVRCPDDLCHGQDECIHGDPPSPCRQCNPKGTLEDRFW